MRRAIITVTIDVGEWVTFDDKHLQRTKKEIEDTMLREMFRRSEFEVNIEEANG